METNPINSTNQLFPPKEKRKRRKKGEGGKRTHICGCGKSYLSYPALYTHTKQKHDGIPPDGGSKRGG